MFSAALDPKDHLFRKMLALSGGFHIVVFVVLVFWTAFSRPPLSIVPVTVVDLVGSGPAAAPVAASPVREERAESPKAARRKESRKARKEVRIATKRAAAPPAVPPAAAMAPLDTRPLAEKIRKMREEKVAEEQAEEAVRGVRREKEIRQAVHGIGERVARRVDLTAARPVPRGTVSPRSPGGSAAGTARLSPEQLAYFRALDEKVRLNWTVPELAVKDRGKLFVQVRIAIEKDGRVSDVRMEAKSGNIYFDDSVRRAIGKASPLPVPPEQLRGNESRYEVGFRFYGSEDAR